MVAWPAANAVLLELNGPGEVDDFGDVADVGPEVWAGEVEAALLRENRTVVEADMNTPVEIDVLIVRQPPAMLATAKPGDQGNGMTVLVEDRRVATAPRQSRFRLTTSEHRGGGEAESVRFELADERAA